RFDLDQFWIAKLRQLKPPVPIWGPHHNDVDLDIFEPVDAVHPRALDLRLAFERHAERGEKSDSGCKVVDDDTDVVQSLDRHVSSYSRGRARRSRPTVLASWTWLAEETQGDEGAAKLQEASMEPMLDGLLTGRFLRLGMERKGRPHRAAPTNLDSIKLVALLGARLALALVGA